jgi:hypothetical protein
MSQSVNAMDLSLTTVGYIEGARVVRRANQDIEDSSRKAASAVSSLESSFQRAGGSALPGFSAAQRTLLDLHAPIKSLSDHVRQLEERFVRIGATIAVFTAVGLGIRAVSGFITESIKAVGEYQDTLIGISASLTQVAVANNAADKTGKTLPQMYADSAKYAEVLALKMRQVDIQSAANYDQIMQMLQVYTSTGNVLNVNNEQQMRGFTALSNAIPILTKGQDLTRQMTTEMRALASGTLTAGSTIAKMVDSMAKASGAGGLKDMIKESKATGVSILELVEPYLQGFVAALPAVEKTLTAAKTSLETAFGAMQRKAFGGVVSDLTIIIQGFIKTIESGTNSVAVLVNGTWTKIRDTLFTMTSYVDKAGNTVKELNLKPEVLAQFEKFANQLIAIGKGFLAITLLVTEHIGTITKAVASYIILKSAAFAGAAGTQLWNTAVNAYNATLLRQEKAMMGVATSTGIAASAASAKNQADAVSMAASLEAIAVQERKNAMMIMSAQQAVASAAVKREELILTQQQSAADVDRLTRNQAMMQGALDQRIASIRLIKEEALAAESSAAGQLRASAASKLAALNRRMDKMPAAGTSITDADNWQAAMAKRTALTEAYTIAQEKAAAATANLTAFRKLDNNAIIQGAAASEGLMATQLAINGVEQQGIAAKAAHVAAIEAVNLANIELLSAQRAYALIQPELTAAVTSHNAKLIALGATTGFLTNQTMLLNRAHAEALIMDGRTLVTKGLIIEAEQMHFAATGRSVGMQRIAVSLAGLLTIGNYQLVSSSAAVTAANWLSATASTAASAAAKLLAGAWTLVGGSLGAVLIALYAGYTWWTNYGEAAKKARELAEGKSNSAKDTVDGIYNQILAQKRLEEAMKRTEEAKKTGSAASPEDTALLAMGSQAQLFLEMTANKESAQKKLNVALQEETEIHKKGRSGFAKENGGSIMIGSAVYTAEIDKVNKNIKSARKELENYTGSIAMLQGLASRGLLKVETPKSMPPAPGDNKEDKEALRLAANNKYNIDQTLKYKDYLRNLKDAQDKAELESAKSAGSEKQAILKGQLDLQMITTNQYNDRKLEIDRTVHKAELTKTQEHYTTLNKLKDTLAADYKEQQGKVAGAAGPKEKDIQIDALNDIGAKQWKNDIDRTNALAAIEKKTSDINILETEGLNIKHKAAMDQAASQVDMNASLMEEAGLLKAASSLREEMALIMKRPANDEEAALRNQLFIIRQIKAEYQEKVNLAQINNKNELNALTAKAAESKRTGSGGGFTAIDDQLAVEKANIKAKYGMERLEIQNKIDILRASSDLELNSIQTLRDAKLAAVDAVYVAEMEAAKAVNEVKYFNQPKLLAAANAAAIKANATYVGKVENVVLNSDKAIAEQKIKNNVNTSAMLSALQTALTQTFVSQKQEELTAEDQAKNAKISMIAQYISAAGQGFQMLADSQDQSSRKGFETAKAYSIGATIMNTAAAVMQQLSSTPGPVGWVAAALAAATGALQLAKIMSTTYKGGGSIGGVSAGSFSGGASGSGGSVGSSIGVPTASISDSLSQDQLEKIAGSMENASLALTKVSDGLTKISDLFKDGSFLKMMSGALTAPAIDPGADLRVKEAVIASLKFSNGIPLGGFKDTVQSAADILTLGFGGSVFGGGQSITGQGLSVGLNKGVSSASNYVQKKEDGGWFHSDKNWTEYTDNKDATGTIQRAVNSVIATVNKSAAVMGTRADLSKATMPTVQIQTAGRKPEDIAKDLEKYMIDVSNVIAKTIPGMEKFAFYGEEAFAAVIRLATSLQAVNGVLNLTNSKLVPATKEGANASYLLIELMGGMEEFTKKTDTYFSSMYTNQEQEQIKFKKNTLAVAAGFAEMGSAVPKTREEFRAMVEGLDITTVSGRQSFEALMKVSGAFGEMTKFADDFAKIKKEASDDLKVRKLAALGRQEESDIISLLIKQEKERLDYQEKGLDTTELAAVQALELNKAVAEMSGTFATAATAITDKAAAMKDKLSATLSAQADIVNTWKDLMLAGASPTDSYSNLKGSFASTYASAKGGDLKALQDISSLSTQFLDNSKSYNGSGMGYQADFQTVTNALADLGGIKGKVGTPLEIANSQLTTLNTVSDLIAQGNIDQYNVLTNILKTNDLSLALWVDFVSLDIQSRKIAAGLGGGTVTDNPETLALLKALGDKLDAIANEAKMARMAP